METWEKELREKLEKELPEGPYEMSAGDMHYWTGKAGAIEHEIAFRKAAKNMTPYLPNYNTTVENSNNLENFRKSIYEWMTKKK